MRSSGFVFFSFFFAFSHYFLNRTVSLIILLLEWFQIIELTWLLAVQWKVAFEQGREEPWPLHYPALLLRTYWHHKNFFNHLFNLLNRLHIHKAQKPKSTPQNPKNPLLQFPSYTCLLSTLYPSRILLSRWFWVVDSIVYSLPDASELAHEPDSALVKEERPEWRQALLSSCCLSVSGQNHRHCWFLTSQLIHHWDNQSNSYWALEDEHFVMGYREKRNKRISEVINFRTYMWKINTST